MYAGTLSDGDVRRGPGWTGGVHGERRLESGQPDRGSRRSFVRVALLAATIAAIGRAGIFLWLQEGVTPVAGQLFGIAGIFGWTMVGVAATLGLVLLSSAPTRGPFYAAHGDPGPARSRSATAAT